MHLDSTFNSLFNCTITSPNSIDKWWFFWEKVIYCPHNDLFVKLPTMKGLSKIKVPGDVQSPEIWQVYEELVSALEKIHIVNMIGSGVRSGKRPLLSSRVRCLCSMEIYRNLVRMSELAMRSSSVTISRVSVISDQGSHCIRACSRMSCSTW